MASDKQPEPDYDALAEIEDPSLRESLRAAWGAWENPQLQARLRAEELERAKIARERERRQQVPRLVTAGVPRKIAKILVEGVDATNAVNAIRGSKKLVTVLAGNPGSGKTTAAASLLLAQTRIRLVTAVYLASLHPRVREDKRELNELARVRHLVIDDVGLETDNAKGNFRSIFDNLLDFRIGQTLRTVITTNLTQAEFSSERHYGARIWSRLGADGDYFELDDPDYRVRALPLSR